MRKRNGSPKKIITSIFLLQIYKYWLIAWIGWNIFLCFLYMEIGILKQSFYILSFKLGQQQGKSWLARFNYGCSTTKPCLFNGHIFDFIFVLIQLILGVIAQILLCSYNSKPLNHASSWNYYKQNNKNNVFESCVTKQNLNDTDGNSLYISNKTITSNLSTLKTKDNDHNRNCLQTNNSKVNITQKPLTQISKRKSPFADIYSNLHRSKSKLTETPLNHIMTTNLDENSFSDLCMDENSNIRTRKLLNSFQYSQNQQGYLKEIDYLNGIKSHYPLKSSASLSTETGYPSTSLNLNSDTGLQPHEKRNDIKRCGNVMIPGPNVPREFKLSNNSMELTYPINSNYQISRPRPIQDMIPFSNTLLQPKIDSIPHSKITDKLMQRQLSLARRRRANRNSHRRRRSSQNDKKIINPNLPPISNSSKPSISTIVNHNTFFNEGYMYMGKPEPGNQPHLNIQPSNNGNSGNYLNGQPQYYQHDFFFPPDS